MYCVIWNLRLTKNCSTVLENSQLRSHSHSSSADTSEFKEAGDYYWRRKKLYFLAEMFPPSDLFNKSSLFALIFYLHVTEDEIIMFPCWRNSMGLMSNFSIAIVLWCFRAPDPENILYMCHSFSEGRPLHTVYVAQERWRWSWTVSYRIKALSFCSLSNWYGIEMKMTWLCHKGKRLKSILPCGDLSWISGDR